MPRWSTPKTQRKYTNLWIPWLSQDIATCMSDLNHTSVPFMKMHGLGNDFLVVDARAADIALSGPLICALADRHRGVGFDQLVVMKAGDTDAHLEFFTMQMDQVQPLAAMPPAA